MADEYRQIWIGEDKINLKGLDLAIQEVARSHTERTDEEVQNALLDRLSEKNYIADCARKEYAEALLKEFRKFLGQSYEQAAGTSLRIVVLGPGCSECNRLEQTVKQALTEMVLPASVEHITDIKEIGKYGLVKTPALIVNDKVVATGSVPSVKKIKEILGKT